MQILWFVQKGWPGESSLSCSYGVVGRYLSEIITGTNVPLPWGNQWTRVFYVFVSNAAYHTPRVLMRFVVRFPGHRNPLCLPTSSTLPGFIILVVIWKLSPWMRPTTRMNIREHPEDPLSQVSHRFHQRDNLSFHGGFKIDHVRPRGRPMNKVFGKITDEHSSWQAPRHPS
jgi:hypothetical protein